jgi:hypothetical protein
MLGDWLLCEVLWPLKYLSPLFDRLMRGQGIQGNSLETHQAPYGMPGPQRLSPMSMPDSAYGRAPHDPMAIYGSSVDAGAFPLCYALKNLSGVCHLCDVRVFGEACGKHVVLSFRPAPVVL